MYKSVFDENNKKRKMNESLVFSVSTIDDAIETIQKCVALVVEKKKSSLAMIIGRVAESVMAGMNDALGNIYKGDTRKVDSVKKQIVAKFMRFFKQDSMMASSMPSEDEM